MKNRLQGLLKDRKTLYLVLAIMIVSVFTLSIAYASLSTILEISGNAQISSAEWDIHLDNVRVKEGSVSANTPVISGTSTLSFDVDLNTPGDFYEFTVDVVNLGSIDAEIDSVVKTPELTSEQAKYIRYEVTYENGESISAKQTLKKGTSTPIKVRVEYRKDIVSSDLPSSVTELSLKLTLVYIQSDGSGSGSPNNGSSESVVRVLSGDGTQVGDEVCIKDEYFYVISSDDTSVTMLAKYNLYVGGSHDGSKWTAYGGEATGKQDSTMLGWVPSSQSVSKGTTAFSNTSIEYEGSIVEGYVNSYNNYLITQGVTPIEARLITKDELVNLGCVAWEKCTDAPEWVYATTYWTGSANDTFFVWQVNCSGSFNTISYNNVRSYGVRPVITISKSDF